MKTLRQDHSEFNCIFVHSDLDDLKLDVHEFRIYAHLARRANSKSRAWPGLRSISDACIMNRHTVIRAIQTLEKLNLIKVVRKSGGLNEYVLTPPSQWKRSQPTSVKTGTGAQNGTGIKIGTGVVPKTTLPPVSKEALKGNPGEGYPLKDNTAREPSDAQETTETPQNDLPSPAPTPNGREPDGLPAMNGQQTHRNPCKDAQTPIHRKAYAIAERLEAHHWDNCKVAFAKESARAYAELALCDGHLESAIVSAYAAALRYCHGYATDGINNGKRHRHEKANPALTIYLARKRLQCDGKTIDERWDTTVAHLEGQRREVARLSAEATAWFAQQHAALTPSTESLANTSDATTEFQQTPGPHHPAQGGVTAAERSEIGPATHASSGRSFSRHAVVAPLWLREMGFPPGTDHTVPGGKPTTRIHPAPPHQRRFMNQTQYLSSRDTTDPMNPRVLPLRVVECPRPTGGTVFAPRCSNRATGVWSHSTTAPQVAHHQPAPATRRPSPVPADHAPRPSLR